MLRVAILAGGRARIRPYSKTIPKALIEINGEPFWAHQLRLLRRHGISHAVLCVGYRGAQIQEYAGDGSRFGLRLDYVFDGPQLLGTAGSIRGALPLLGDAFFVLYGYSYLPCDYSAVGQAFLQTPAMLHIDYGLGVFRSMIFEALAEGFPADLAIVHQDHLRCGQLVAFEVRERFYEIGSFEGIRELAQFVSR
jgi:N-acetyl-alpha-D-muramate 1-phosphate uridylyltransferase